MKYVILVSHGNFAEGLLNSLEMLVGSREDIIAVGLNDGTTLDQFTEKFQQSIAKIPEDSEVIILADIIGGSPLSTAMNIMSNNGMLNQCKAIGGMNLPLALTVLLMKDNLDMSNLVETVRAEALEAIKEFALDVAEDEENDI